MCFSTVFFFRRDIRGAGAAFVDVFNLNAATGELSVGTKRPLDYEAVSEYTLQIVTTDSGSPSFSFTGTVLITVTDINEAPDNISLSGNMVRCLGLF